MKKNQFSFVETSLSGVFIIEKARFEDERGVFIKSYNKQEFDSAKISCDFRESYFSISKKNVLRGMHYQRYPHHHAKLITVIEGEILDVCVGVGENLDKKSKGKYFSIILSKNNNKSIYIPGGYAHGFLCLSETAIVMSHMTAEFDAQHEEGIHYLSFGFSWPIDFPILSEKDKNLRNF